VEHDILKEFLEADAADAWEVMNMLLAEWNWDDARAVWRTEGRTERDAELLAMIEAGGNAPEQGRSRLRSGRLGELTTFQRLRTRNLFREAAGYFMFMRGRFPIHVAW
jgi:hypothetical protein